MASSCRRSGRRVIGPDAGRHLHEVRLLERRSRTRNSEKSRSVSFPRLVIHHPDITVRAPVPRPRTSDSRQSTSVFNTITPSVVELDLADLVDLLVDPGDLPRVPGVLVSRCTRSTTSHVNSAHRAPRARSGRSYFSSSSDGEILEGELAANKRSRLVDRRDPLHTLERGQSTTTDRRDRESSRVIRARCHRYRRGLSNTMRLLSPTLSSGTSRVRSVTSVRRLSTPSLRRSATPSRGPRRCR